MGLMMAEISDPTPDPGPYQQPMYGGRPTAAAIVTAITGIWAGYNGFILLIIGNYIPDFSLAMMFMGIGSANIILGLVNIFAGYGVYNFKSSGKALGIVANIIIIVLNIILMAIGLVGIALCIISIILLGMYNQ